MKTEGKWITVRPDDPRIKDGSRVRLGGVEGDALRWSGSIVALDGNTTAAWRSRCDGGPDIELLVPAEVTLPLPDGPGVFWGRIERGHETYIGWVLHAPGVPAVSQLVFGSPILVGGAIWHGSWHVTRLPVPDEKLEKLR